MPSKIIPLSLLMAGLEKIPESLPLCALLAVGGHTKKGRRKQEEEEADQGLHWPLPSTALHASILGVVYSVVPCYSSWITKVSTYSQLLIQ